jgi:hypothetical protein
VLLCVLCLIVVPLPPGTKPFAVKINNNNKVMLKDVCGYLQNTSKMQIFKIIHKILEQDAVK